jgi:hypothetical protein
MFTSSLILSKTLIFYGKSSLLQDVPAFERNVHIIQRITRYWLARFGPTRNETMGQDSAHPAQQASLAKATLPMIKTPRPHENTYYRFGGSACRAI